jgi:hypothetical protein
MAPIIVHSYQFVVKDVGNVSSFVIEIIFITHSGYTTSAAVNLYVKKYKYLFKKNPYLSKQGMIYKNNQL